MKINLKQAKTMREMVFEVPAGLMVEFAGSLGGQEMYHAMEGVTEGDDDDYRGTKSGVPFIHILTIKPVSCLS